MATALHAQNPNEVVHMDYLYIGPATKGNLKYVLLLKDDLSSYCWLYPAAAPDAHTAATALAKWMAAFGGMDWLVTDRGSHFTAQVMASLTEDAKVRHHFTTPYCPWANGTVERLCREVLRAGRALLSEWRMMATEWPNILDCIQTVINQSPVERLGKKEGEQEWRTPVEVFTGHKPTLILARPLPLERLSLLNPIEPARAR